MPRIISKAPVDLRGKAADSVALRISWSKDAVDPKVYKLAMSQPRRALAEWARDRATALNGVWIDQWGLVEQKGAQQRITSGARVNQ